MTRARRVCPTPGCPAITDGGRCPTCRTAAEQRRGSAAQRGYARDHAVRFRRAVLLRDLLCVCEGGCCDRHTHAGGACLAPSKHADHWPRDKRQLRRAGLDEHDPDYGRGLCSHCHSHTTAHAQPGGWNAR